MSKYFKVSEMSALSILSIYRMLLKSMKHYPSSNRHDILLAVQEEFHQNKNLTEEKDKKLQRKKA